MIVSGGNGWVFLSPKILSAAARARARGPIGGAYRQRGYRVCRGRDPAFEDRYTHEASAPLVH